MPDLTDDTTFDLESLGFGPHWAELFEPLAENGFVPARVVRVDREFPLVATAGGLVRAEPAVHLVKTRGTGSRAVVGDWVALARPAGHDLAIIEAILPRTSAFSRKDPGEDSGEQVLIANADVVFVMQSLSGRGVNLRRLERELVLAHESHARPIVVLSKADLCRSVEYQREIAEGVALGVDVIAESAITGDGLAEIRAAIPAGTTAALLGGSGVGKSTLVNRLVGGEVQATAEVRSRDDKGRHTTVARELVQLPDGGVIIDTPGMRGLALFDAERGLADAFADIAELAEGCRFANCTHTGEPGCAVLAAVESGELDARRLTSYRHLRDELGELARRQEEAAWKRPEAAPKGRGASGPKQRRSR